MSAFRIYFRPFLGWASVVALLAFPLFSVSGALDMFIKIDGIKGESATKDHKDEIDVLAWSWGMSNSSNAVGKGGKAGKPTVQEIAFTKYLDKSSPALMLSTLKGKRHDQAVLTVSNRTAGKVSDFLVITLTDVLITSVSSGGSSGESRLTENVTVDFGKFKLEYKESGKDGKQQGKAETVEYNISTNKSN